MFIVGFHGYLVCGCVWHIRMSWGVLHWWLFQLDENCIYKYLILSFLFMSDTAHCNTYLAYSHLLSRMAEMFSEQKDSTYDMKFRPIKRIILFVLKTHRNLHHKISLGFHQLYSITDPRWIKECTDMWEINIFYLLSRFSCGSYRILLETVLRYVVTGTTCVRILCCIKLYST